MKIYWRDGALNVQPETEEDGQITSAILFAYGSEAPESNLANVKLQVSTDSRIDDADQKSVVGVNMALDGIVKVITGSAASNKPF